MKVRIRHTKLGKVRFTSHRDTARHWERAVRKAGLSVAYSAGFTPRPKMSFGLALPTGAESLAEYLDIDFVETAEPLDLAVLSQQCSEALPVGYSVTCMVPREAGSVSLQEGVVACDWLITLGNYLVLQYLDPVTGTWTLAIAERTRLAALAGLEPWPWTLAELTAAAHAKRFDQWQPVPEPILEDWLLLLDAVQRMVVRRR